MTTIILNAEAVNALFPEGSESRLKLSSNVADILVKSLTLKHVKELSAEVQGGVKKVSVDALRSMGIGTDFRGMVRIEDHVTKAIQEHTRQQAQRVMYEAVDQALKDRRETIDAHMGNLDTLIQRRVNVLVDAKLKDEVKKAMRELLSRP